MDNKSVLAVALSLVAVVGVIFVIATRPAVVTKVVTNEDGTKTKTYAGAGADTSYDCESHNGVTTCSYSKEFNNASTTLASFRSPSATSTLSVGAASITTASTSALQFEWGRSELNSATTTSLGIYNLAASVKAMIMASTTDGNTAGSFSVDRNYIIPPNTNVNLKYGGNTCDVGAAACNTLEGKAIVEFKY